MKSNYFNYFCRFITAFIVLATIQNVYGQQVITGTVRNKQTQEPIPNVSIKVTSSFLSSPAETTTDNNGKFVLQRLTAGKYTLITSSSDFYHESLIFILAPRAVQQIEIELSPLRQINETVEIKTSKLLLDETQNSSVELIDQGFINHLPMAQGTNFPDLISTFVPSAISSHDNFVHLRGNELSLNTSINGVSFIDNPHQYFTPGLNPDVLQSFSVITGGFPAEYGNRFGGIVDAVTRSGFDGNNHGAITLGLSTYLRNNASIQYGGHTEKFGYFIYGSGFKSQRFINPPQPQQLHDFGKGVRTFAQFDYKATLNDTLRLMIINSGVNFEIPNTVEEQERGRDFFQRSREQTAIFNWEHIISPKSFLITSFSERLTAVRLVPTNDLISIQASGLRKNNTFGLRSDYTQLVGAKQTIKAGLELTGWHLHEDFTFDPRTNEFEIPAFNFRKHKFGGEIGIYAQDRIQFTRNLVANLGLRYDKYRLLTGEQELSPRINIAYTISLYKYSNTWSL